MGLRYYKRVDLGDGYGLNVSKSGISSSYRSKYGSIGPRGFSIRTGIPGLTFRGGFGGSKKGEGAIIALFFILFIGAIIILTIVVWNVALFLKWTTEETYKLIVRERRKHKIKKEVELYKDSDYIKFIQFSQNYFPTEHQESDPFIDDILVENGTEIKEGDELAILVFGDNEAILISDENGKITFYKTPGEKLKIGDYIYKIEK